jgi:hypothetical protein
VQAVLDESQFTALVFDLHVKLHGDDTSNLLQRCLVCVPGKKHVNHSADIRRHNTCIRNTRAAHTHTHTTHDTHATQNAVPSLHLWECPLPEVAGEEVWLAGREAVARALAVATSDAASGSAVARHEHCASGAPGMPDKCSTLLLLSRKTMKMK